MRTDWTKRDIVNLLDFYVQNLRILARRSEGRGLPEDGLCRGRHSLYDFDLAGIKASGYPEVFDRPDSAVYATPRAFREFTADEKLNDSAIALDPRYVAFRTAHDWVILHAKVLAEDKAARRQVLDLSDRLDPFDVELPCDVPYESAGLTAGNPLHLADGGFRNRWNPDYAEPWHKVIDPIEAIHYFHFRGTFRLQERRQAPHMQPAGLAGLLAAQIVEGCNSSALHAWHSVPPEEVVGDPRFIAHKCAFNRAMLEGMPNRPSELHSPRTEALDLIEFEQFLAFFGETTVRCGKPN